MPDRVASDHPSVETIRGELARHGGTRRLVVRLPAERRDAVPVGEVVRIVVGGDERHARIDERADGTPIVPGAYDSPRLARSGGGTDRLAAWIDANGLDAGRSVLFDVVEPGVRYGLRAPGTTAVYDAPDPPAGELRDIARRLDGS